jgi:hypothetical protein
VVAPRHRRWCGRFLKSSVQRAFSLKCEKGMCHSRGRSTRLASSVGIGRSVRSRCPTRAVDRAGHRRASLSRCHARVLRVALQPAGRFIDSSPNDAIDATLVRRRRVARWSRVPFAWSRIAFPDIRNTIDQQAHLDSPRTMQRH